MNHHEHLDHFDMPYVEEGVFQEALRCVLGEDYFVDGDYKLYDWS